MNRVPDRLQNLGLRRHNHALGSVEGMADLGGIPKSGIAAPTAGQVPVVQAAVNGVFTWLWTTLTIIAHAITNHNAGTIGDFVYATTAGAWALLAGNSTATRKFLSMTSSVPSWNTLADGDIPKTLTGMLDITSGGLRTSGTASAPSGNPSGGASADAIDVMAAGNAAGTRAEWLFYRGSTLAGRVGLISAAALGTIAGVAGADADLFFATNGGNRAFLDDSDAGRAVAGGGFNSGASYQHTGRELFAQFDHYADVANVTTGETDLYSDTLPAAVLANNGDKVEVHYAGVLVPHATASRQLRVYFGGTLIGDSGALSIAVGSDAWDITALLIRVSSSVVRCIVTITVDNTTLAAPTTYTEVTGLTLANTAILKCTGQAAGVGAATGDITAKLGMVRFVPAA